MVLFVRDIVSKTKLRDVLVCTTGTALHSTGHNFPPTRVYFEVPRVYQNEPSTNHGAAPTASLAPPNIASRGYHCEGHLREVRWRKGNVRAGEVGSIRAFGKRPFGSTQTETFVSYTGAARHVGVCGPRQR